MNVQDYMRIISGERTGLSATGLRAALRVLSGGYSVATRLRNLAFDRGLRASHQVSVPVISVGNLTTGGTGKTPVVAAVVKMLQEGGRCPGIVSRGYGADDTGTNDEQRVLSRLCPGVPHEQNPDRVVASKKLIQNAGVDVIVLDDAFQHRRLARQLDIVLIDATNPFGFGHQLPRGLLRESLRGLSRADLVLITRADRVSAEDRELVRKVVVRHNARLAERCVCVSFDPTALENQVGDQKSLGDVNGQPVGLMTAIGNPAAFENTCQQLGANIVSTAFFADHHLYRAEDLRQVRRESDDSGARFVLTTLKDLVKLPADMGDWWAVQIETCFGSDTDRSLVKNCLHDACDAEHD